MGTISGFFPAFLVSPEGFDLPLEPSSRCVVEFSWVPGGVDPPFKFQPFGLGLRLPPLGGGKVHLWDQGLGWVNPLLPFRGGFYPWAAQGPVWLIPFEVARGSRLWDPGPVLLGAFFLPVVTHSGPGFRVEEGLWFPWGGYLGTGFGGPEFALGSRGVSPLWARSRFLRLLGL